MNIFDRGIGFLLFRLLIMLFITIAITVHLGKGCFIEKFPQKKTKYRKRKHGKRWECEEKIKLRKKMKTKIEEKE